MPQTENKLEDTVFTSLQFLKIKMSCEVPVLESSHFFHHFQYSAVTQSRANLLLFKVLTPSKDRLIVHVKSARLININRHTELCDLF